MPALPRAEPPLLVIVTGQAATGKTALAHRLASELTLPLISKDALKESLFDSLGWSDREWSMRLGRASILLVYKILESLLSAGVSVITETAFHSALARDEFLAIQARAPFRPFVIECVADGEVIWQRWQNRIQTGERHPGHVDDTIQDAEVLLKRKPAPLELGGRRVEIDTTHFEAIDLGPLLLEIKALIR